MRTAVSLSITVLILFLVSCGYNQEFEIPQFADPEDAIAWIRENIDGEMDGNVYPIPVILERRAGGCTAFAGLFLYILKEQFGEDAKIAITLKNGYGHTVVYWDGQYYDLTNKETYLIEKPDIILYYWTLDYYNFRASL